MCFPAAHLCFQEAAERSLLLDVLPAQRDGYAQHQDHHHEEAADHPRCDQRGSEDTAEQGGGGEEKEEKQVNDEDGRGS